jgi:hypothetical protein
MLEHGFIATVTEVARVGRAGQLCVLRDRERRLQLLERADQPRGRSGPQSERAAGLDDLRGIEAVVDR